MSFLKHKIAITAAVLSVMMSAAILGSSLTYAFSSNYKSWKQYDSSWSMMHLGDSSDTVQASGCVVTAAAILMVHSGSVTSSDFNPGVLVEFLNQNGGFSSSGNLNWWVLSSYVSDFKYINDCDNTLHGTTQAEKAAEIQNFLDNGYYVMVRISRGKTTHYVAVDSVSGDNVKIMDPGYSADSLFDKYSVDSVTQVRLFRGKNSTPETVPETTEQVFIPPVDAPETAPVAPETFPPETSTEAPEPETTVSTTTLPEISTTIATTLPIIETTTEETTTTLVTTPEIVITTAPETTDPIIYTRTETLPTETEFTSETIFTESVPQETVPAETVPGTVEFVILEDAPETAPAIAGQPLPTSGKPKTRTIYVPEEQAEATLIELNHQHVFMSVRFIVKTDLNLRLNPDFDSDILTVIPAGTSLNVVEVNEDFTWGRVSLDGAEGWIALDFAEL